MRRNGANWISIKSKILWTAPKTTGHGHFGECGFISGSLNYSLAGEPTSGSFKLNMNTISSTDNTSAIMNKRVDEELKGSLFLEVAKHPTADIIVQQMVKVPNSDIYKVKAILRLKGITNLIVFNATINEKGNVIYATADFTIDRTKWNIGHQAKTEYWNIISAIKDKAIDDDVSISLRLVFNQ